MLARAEDGAEEAARRAAECERAKATTPVVTMPPGFKDEWRLIKELRKDRTAVVDTMGCERLADPQASEKDRDATSSCL